jgi:branched-chain amino acid transport system substrate-binding protein
MKKKLAVAVFTCSALFIAGTAMSANTIKIGYNIPLTGDIPRVG